jgi:hypothetical protein
MQCVGRATPCNLPHARYDTAVRPWGHREHHLIVSVMPGWCHPLLAACWRLAVRVCACTCMHACMVQCTCSEPL